ncbi:hypothetical protein [Vibrio barjaei]|uniref:hypothetical protein n=1 Tax=Vibrio barjaei TaxID=1676683 RepID=UPI002284AC09|nr:hypothetical protein [Vibrio barjaei]MCY9870503.1 hypothetical protein [Vibrio barjaei]
MISLLTEFSTVSITFNKIADNQFALVVMPTGKQPLSIVFSSEETQETEDAVRAYLGDPSAYGNTTNESEIKSDNAKSKSQSATPSRKPSQKASKTSTPTKTQTKPSDNTESNTVSKTVAPKGETEGMNALLAKHGIKTK